METMITGTKAPDIIMKDADHNQFELDSFETQCRYIIILFWSAGCSHCMEMINKLFPWQQQTQVQQQITVIAISLDDTETEIKAWEQEITELKGWKHLRAAEGIRSKVAGDYFVLSTPVMVLLDAKTRKIIATPNSLKELWKALE